MKKIIKKVKEPRVREIIPRMEHLDIDSKGYVFMTFSNPELNGIKYYASASEIGRFCRAIYIVQIKKSVKKGEEFKEYINKAIAGVPTSELDKIYYHKK
jgi:hypothetical protein